jgi:hypothetical protein
MNRQYLIDRAVYISYEIIKLKKALKHTVELQQMYHNFNIHIVELPSVILSLKAKIKKFEKYCYKYIGPLIQHEYTQDKHLLEEWKKRYDKGTRNVFGEYDPYNFIEIENTLNYGPTYFSTFELEEGHVLLTQLIFNEEKYLIEVKEMGLDLHTGAYTKAVNMSKGKVTVKPMKNCFGSIIDIY